MSANRLGCGAQNIGDRRGGWFSAPMAVGDPASGPWLSRGLWTLLHVSVTLRTAHGQQDLGLDGGRFNICKMVSAVPTALPERGLWVLGHPYLG